MDKLERYLKLLPRHTPPAGLAARVCDTVLRRHRVRVIVRRLSASTLAIAGFALAWPGFAGLSPDLFSSATPWLSGSLGLFEIESVQAVGRLWNDMFSLQSSINSSVLVSAWLGILLIGIGLSVVMDRRVFLPPLNSFGEHGHSSRF